MTMENAPGFSFIIFEITQSNYIKNPIFSSGDEKLYLVRPLPK